MPNFKKYYTINALPEEVYAALTNAATLQLWTGTPAIMDETVGNNFSLWEGTIEGKNLAFEKGKMIQQQWFFGDEELEENPDASIVTIKLHLQKNKTSLELLHTNIPEQDFDAIVEGWNEVYMESLIWFYEGE
jgi:activator of HSP90 ATPase